jgi:hypothetical protein
MKNVGQFGRCEPIVLSDLNNCPLTDYHPGANLQNLCGDEKCIALR